MWLRVRFELSLIVLFLLALTGCGGSGNGGAGPINGPFSNSSLSGSYAFSFTGVNQFGFLAVAGTFQANGSGTITSGTLDVNSGNGVFTNQSLTGNYNVHNNGQGTATLVANAGTFDINFVMISTRRALVIRFDNNSTASGSIDAQSPSAFSLSALGGTFAFNLSGILDASEHILVSAGAIDNDGAGTIPSGVQDNNENGTPVLNQGVTGSNAVSTTKGRGTMTLNTGLGTLQFAFYVVDNNQIKLIEIDTLPVLAGDAFRQVFPQSTASVSGPLAFTVGGESSGFPFAAGGVLVTDGAGHVTSGTQDINNGGSIAQNVSVTGTYLVGADGRGSLTLNGSTGTTNFIIYPTTSGVQILQVDVGESNIGAAFSQVGPFSNSTVSGTYGLNLTGVTSANNEIDSSGQFTADGAGHLTGALDVNNGGGLTSNLSLSGNYSVASNGRGTATINSAFGPQNLILYTVSNGRVVFIEVDSNLVAVGEMDHQ